jgi:hypothetical protein
MTKQSKTSTETETSTEIETTQPETVGLSELHKVLETRAEEMRAEEIEADRIKARALIELNDIEEATRAIGTDWVVGTLTTLRNRAAEAIAEAIDNDADPTGAIDQRRKATAQLASLATLEEVAEPTYTLPDLSALAAAAVLRSLAASLPDDPTMPTIDVEVDESTRAAILAAVGRVISPIATKETRSRAGVSNRRGARHLSWYVAGETFVLSHGANCRYVLTGTISPSGDLVGTHLTDTQTLNGPVPLEIGQQFGASHPTLTTLTAHPTAYGTGIVGSPSALAKALAADEGSTALNGPSESGYRIVKLTSGPGAGQTLDDYVPFVPPIG